MNIDQLFSQSLQLLFLGMGSVFGILIFLIGIISVVSKLIPEEQIVDPLKKESVPASLVVNTQHIAAIQTAVHLFRN